MYVTASSRRQGKATWLAKIIEEKARQAKCKFLTTTINTEGKIDVTRSMSAIISYGFKYDCHQPTYIIFSKELK